MANKAYKFRLYPTKEQEQLLAKTFGCVRFVYNQMLAERKEVYEQYKDNKAALKQQKLPTPAKYKNEFPWLKEVDSLALANAQLNLQKAYQNFFAGHAEIPKFKSRKARQSYTTNVVNGNIKLLDGYIQLPKLKMNFVTGKMPSPAKQQAGSPWPRFAVQITGLDAGTYQGQPHRRLTFAILLLPKSIQAEQKGLPLCRSDYYTTISNYFIEHPSPLKLPFYSFTELCTLLRIYFVFVIPSF